MDLRTAWFGFDAGADYVVGALGLAEDDGLETAVVLSLFSDRRAAADDELPFGETDRRGWWADAWPEIDGDRIGSRLWLLHREKQTQTVVNRAREYAEEALAWLVEDGVARRVQVQAEIVRQGVLGLTVQVFRAADPAPAQFRFETFWRGQ